MPLTHNLFASKRNNISKHTVQVPDETYMVLGDSSLQIISMNLYIQPD